jgi:hypothetical protein
VGLKDTLKCRPRKFTTLERYAITPNPFLLQNFQKPSPETDKLKPWTKLAKAKLAAEEELKKIQG